MDGLSIFIILAFFLSGVGLASLCDHLMGDQT